MKVVYDWVTCSGVTDGWPGMLTVMPNSAGSVVWKKGPSTSRYIPYWLKVDSLNQAAKLVYHYSKTLPRSGGTLIVQLRSPTRSQSFDEVSIHHALSTKAHAVNPLHPTGLPIRIRHP